VRYLPETDGRTPTATSYVTQNGSSSSRPSSRSSSRRSSSRSTSARSHQREVEYL